MSSVSKSAPYCSCTQPSDCVDLHPGRYLVGMYWLVVEDDGPVSTGDLSDRLGVSPASVTEMVEKLAAAGFVDHEKHHGSELTERGEEVGRELAWRQCAVRVFFASVLDTEVSPDEGYRIGYNIPAIGVRRLQELADPSPDGCCHGEAYTDSVCMFGSRANG